MSRVSVILVLTVAATLGARVRAESADKSKTIPLDQIWGYNLPGTRDIAGIPFPEKTEGVSQTLAVLTREREYNIEQIRVALAIKPPTKAALPGFVLPFKVNSHTLSGVLSPLRGKPNPFQRAFPEGEFTLVFFSHPLSYYARLRKVERDGNKITVHYQFEPHMTPEATVHLAFIPLGKLSADKYRVTYKQEPIDKQYRDIGFEPVNPDEIVCRDFSFTVGEPKKDEVSYKPLYDVWGYMIPRTRNVDELDGANPITLELSKIISARSKRREKAGPAFAVEGIGKTALENMLAAFKSEPPRYVPADKENSLVFHTNSSGYYVHVETIDRNDQIIVVSYRFVKHSTFDASFHFALIPIKLPAGTYKIEVKQLSTIDEEGRPVKLDRDLSSVVCQSSTFTVKGKP